MFTINIFSFLLLLAPLPFLAAFCQPEPPQANELQSPSYQSGEQPPLDGRTPVGQTGNWNIIFRDEFTATRLDPRKWTTCYFNFKVDNGCEHDQGELQLYQPGQLSVSNGTLKLRADKRTINASNGKAYDYTSGMVTTGPTTGTSNDTRFSFQYGYMEMRAKVPAGKGLWPAFWLLPADLNWPPEIDVFEILGNDPHTVNMHYHYPNLDGGDGDTGTSWSGPDFSAGWHTFAVDWEPQAITWYVDGVARRRFTNQEAIPAKPMYLLANLAVGGDWPGSPDATTHFPATFEIDYIRVWKKAA